MVPEQQHPHLCHACMRKKCDADDTYAGLGTLTCLLDHAADAAIVSDVDIKKIRTIVRWKLNRKGIQYSATFLGWCFVTHHRLQFLNRKFEC